MLKISSDLKLPLDFITQTCAVLARRGAGKSYFASVLTEELVKNNLQTVVVDPIGVFWGLRSSVDGKHEGLPVVIFGGDHGDLPIESTSGTLIADIILEKKLSAVIDLSLLRKGEQDSFMMAFAERLYFKNRTPLHLIVDEADTFAPQKPLPGQQRMLGAMEDLVRKGRARGIGMTMVTQRSAVINKNLLSQAEVLVCLQTIAPQDRAAVLTWVEAHGSEEECRIMMSSLASLPVGTAWVWSPAWAKCFKQVKVRLRETFDSSSTPKAGSRVVVPKKLAPVEIESLKVQLAAVIEKKNADDPRILRKRIAELEAQLKKTPTQIKEKIIEKIVEVKVIPADVLARMTQLSDRVAGMTEMLKGIQQSVGAAKAEKFTFPEKPLSAFHKSFVKPRAVPKPTTLTPTAVSDVKLSTCQRKILTVLAQYPQGKTKRQVAVIAGYAHGGGSFNNSVCNLRANSLITGSDDLQITEEGMAALGDFTPLPVGQELAEYWFGQLDKCKSQILKYLMDVHPRAATKEEIAEAIGYEAGGGSFNNSICRLRSLELAEGSKEIKASDNLFGG